MSRPGPESGQVKCACGGVKEKSVNDVTQSGCRIAIIGAGPIGLEAGLFARQQGYAVTVLERGRVAENVRNWGHVRLFSPFAMNSSPWGRALLSETDGTRPGAGGSLPDGDELLTGMEFAERYLIALSRQPLISDSIRENTEVLAIGRDSIWKTDVFGSQRRNSPFRILVRTPQGEAEVLADVVLDCSGTYGNHNWLGGGGVPCRGERECESRILWTLPDVSGGDRDRFAGRTTLLAGSGYSAATVVVQLAALAREVPGTSVIWLSRTQRSPPVSVVPTDSLSERAELTARANQCALDPDSVVDWRPGQIVRAIGAGPGERLTVTVDSDAVSTRVEVDEVVALVGYRPNRSLYEELQIHECYATQGPIKLAAALLADAGQDCLEQSCPGPETLTSPEPDFFVLGAKSYGRSSQFLLRVGMEQIPAVFSLISGGRAGDDADDTPQTGVVVS